MIPLPVQFRLPDLLSFCPLRGGTNPHYDEVVAQARNWINSYDIFVGRERAFFIMSCHELLVSRAYAYAGPEEFRTACDFINILFVFDEISDVQRGRDALATSNTFRNAMEDQEWNDHSPFCLMTKQFRSRFLRLARPRAKARFLKHWGSYCAAVVKEAELREACEILDVESFLVLRRENSAVPLCFDLSEHCIGADLPDEVFEDRTFQEIYWAAVDLICWSNDVYSYDREQSRGTSGNNIVTVLMKERCMTLQEAADHVGLYCEELMDRFTSARIRLPSWGPVVDSEVARYIQGLEFWIKGNLDWSFETRRYFGDNYPDIKSTRLVTLRLPERP